MNKKVFFTLFIALAFASLSNAAIYKGQKYFKKQCLACHTNQKDFVASKTKAQWKELFANKGGHVLKIHQSDGKAKDSLKYFTGKKFPKNARHLKQFLVEYAKDSGNVLAIN